MNKIAYSILLSACFLLFAESSHCEWTKVCRPGADFRCLTFSGNTLFGSASASSLQASGDWGATWGSIIPLKFEYDRIFYRIQFFREIALVGTDRGGILCSTNGGGWGLTSNVGSDDILAFAESRGKAAVKFFAGGFGGGIRVSLDSGQTWVPLISGPVNANVTSLASGRSLPDSTGQVLFAGTYGGGIFTSTNNGQNWSPKNQGLSGLLITGLEVVEDVLYASASGGKVYRSSDWGNSWVGIGIGLPDTEVLCVTAVRLGPEIWTYCGTIDAGVWRCRAEGGVWNPVNSGLGNLRINSIVFKEGALFAGTHGGIFRSWDYGTSWTLVGPDLFPPLVTLGAVNFPGNVGEDHILAGTDETYRGSINPVWASLAFTTRDDGNTWSTMTFSRWSYGGDRYTYNYSGAKLWGPIKGFAAYGDLVFLMEHGNGDRYPVGPYVSNDKGLTWKGPLGEFVWCWSWVIRSRKQDGRLEFFNADHSPGNNCVQFSADTGRSWSTIRPTTANVMGYVDSSLVICDYTGTFRTSNYGATWEDITINLSGNQVKSFVNNGNSLLACISYDPANGRPGGVLMTTDVGNSWLPAGLGGKTVTSLVLIDNCLLAAADGKVYAALKDQYDWVDVSGNIVGTPVGIVTATSQSCYLLGSDGKSIWKRPMTEIMQALSVVPAPPQLLTPANGTSGLSVSANMRWTRPTSAISFWLQVAADSMFSNPLVFNSQSIADTFAQVTGLNHGQRYFWRVAAGSSSGFGPFSPRWSFTTIVAPPQAPALRLPSPNTTLTSASTVLSWSAAQGATLYHLQVASDSLYALLTINDSTLTDSLRQIALNPGKTYYWRVRARNDGGFGPFSATWNFNVILATPLLKTPLNGTTDLPSAVSLMWHPVPMASGYRVQVTKDSTFNANPIVDVSTSSDTSRVVQLLLDNATYYWRVRAEAPGTYGPYSSTWRFQTLLGVPSMVQPTDNATNQFITPLLSWHPVAGATAYHVQLGRTVSLDTALVLNDSTVTDTVRTVSSLQHDTQYYWHVRSRTPTGTSPFAPAWSFRTVQVQASAPDLVYPPNNTFLQSNVVGFVWRKANPAVTRYWLELATDSVFQFRTVDSLIVDTTFVRTGVPGNRYWWHVRAYNSAGWGPFSVVRRFTLEVSGVDQDHEIPSTFVLTQNFPNPFNPATMIRFGLPTSSTVTLVVYNTLGEEIQTLVNANLLAGYHVVEFNATRVPSGIYFYRMRTGDFVETKKLLLLR